MIVVKFPLGYTTKSSTKITFLLVFYILLSNSVNSQNMDDFIEYDSFVIVEKPQKVYKGFYKDGKPYNGYFSKGNDEFPRVDYYENGEAKFQYSLDVYQMALGAESSEVEGLQEQEGEVMNEEDYEEYMKDLYKPKLNIKSVYESGKIVDGYEYGELNSGIISRKIEKQKTTAFHIDAFAMHYYQRTSLVLVSDTLIIGSPTIAAAGENIEIRLFKKNQAWVTNYHIGGEKIGSNYYIKGDIESLPANCTLFIYDQNNATYNYGRGGFEKYSTRLDLIDIQKMYFDNPEIFSNKNMQSFFDAFIEAFTVEIQKEDKQRLQEPEVFRGYIITGESSEILKGIRFFEKEENSYYEEYKDSSKIKKEKIDLINFQKVFKEYLENTRND
ncbi:hypothetical protein [uncultured Aquimarina sp.]|uniref:hypothetical protein n=1 Tax=uncultured Aquimarina sp. TaxID=575652 RepID=UPI0026205A2E|nr:hypothetical protein [uncultured Aquimarina sp.]